jgi:hypothetical protein
MISIRISMGIPKIVKGRTRVDSRRKGASTKIFVSKYE